MRALINWFRWEFGRSIEVTGVIRFIIVERFVKAAVLIGGGITLLVVSNRSDLHQFALTLQTQLNLDPGRGVFHRLLDRAIVQFGSLSRARESALAIAAAVYGVLEGGEGVGLLLRRRWAEYLVLIATVAFLPVEIDEVVNRVTILKAGALAINVAIVAYLVWRKRLFLERPGHEVADRTG